MIVFLTFVFTIIYIVMGFGIKALAKGKLINSDDGKCFTESGVDSFAVIIFWPLVLLFISIMRGFDD